MHGGLASSGFQKLGQDAANDSDSSVSHNITSLSLPHTKPPSPSRRSEGVVGSVCEAASSRVEGADRAGFFRGSVVGIADPEGDGPCCSSGVRRIQTFVGKPTLS